MKIAIDAQILPGQGGVGEYTIGLTRELLRQGRHEYTLFTNALARERLGADSSRAAGVIHADASPVSLAWLAFGLPAHLRRLGADVYHGPAFVLPFRKTCTQVATVHDMIYKLFPKTMTWRRRIFWEVMMKNTWAKADFIFADSLNTKRDIGRLGPATAARIAVVPAAVEGLFNSTPRAGADAALRKRLGLPARYFLSVCTLEPRKNLQTVIAAFQRYRQNGGTFDLVLVGPRGWLAAPIFRAVAATRLEASIHFTGWVAREDLPGIYRQARALVFPSLYEGFGLPVLEAMSAGTPVVISRISSLPEVAGQAALYVDPRRSDDLAGWMQQLEKDERLVRRCRASGLKQARSFTWKRAAGLAANLYERVARQGRRP